jgi:acyl-CoA thioester hydrolase
MDKDGLVETYRSAVAAWESDVMGHLTIAYYFDRLADAAFNLIERVVPGAPAGAMWRHEHLAVRYERELRAGDGLAIRSGVIGRDGDRIRLGHVLLNSGTGARASVAVHRLVPRELPYGAMAEQRHRLAQAVVDWQEPGFDDAPEPGHAERMVDSGQDRVKAAELDERGELALAGFVHRFAHACLHACAAFGMTPDYMRTHKRGFSTFETRLQLLAPPPGAGDSIVVKSGLLAAGNSSLRLLHEMRHARNGEVLARMHQSGVHFDMEARRSAPLPDELRRQAASLVVA